jgi:hypothetical protein
VGEGKLMTDFVVGIDVADEFIVIDFVEIAPIHITLEE